MRSVFVNVMLIFENNLSIYLINPTLTFEVMKYCDKLSSNVHVVIELDTLILK